MDGHYYPRIQGAQFSNIDFHELCVKMDRVQHHNLNYNIGDPGNSSKRSVSRSRPVMHSCKLATAIALVVTQAFRETAVWSLDIKKKLMTHTNQAP